jgi:uncharacterized membrane protein YeaQ/YmgE (transglycosylase-associated protein family)
MALLTWVFFGFIAGFIASRVLKRTRQGVVRDIVLGIVGAIIGGSLFATFGMDGAFVTVLALLLAGYFVVSQATHYLSFTRSS